nr:ribonuclease H-like domain-containing protein [Tanacetum cinerariifolium]
MSSVQTPQQNVVVERQNRTLVEAARTMLIFSRASLFLWAEAIATAKPDISFLHVFGALCYPKNDREDIGKLGAKGDIGFFIGYSADSCAYRIYNRRTKKIIETMNVSFDELSALAFEQRTTVENVPPAQEHQDVDELNLNAMVDGNTFVNPFATSSSNAAETSSSAYSLRLSTSRFLHNRFGFIQDAAHIVAASKVPMLKPIEFELWRIRIEQELILPIELILLALRECKAPKGHDNRSRDVTRRTMPEETPNSSALVSCDGLGGHDWSDQAKEGPTNYALMGYSTLSASSSYSKDTMQFHHHTEACSHLQNQTCLIQDDEEEKVEKKEVKASINRINFVKAITDNNPRETVTNGEQPKQNTHRKRDNKRNWNGMLSHKLGSNWDMLNKSCYECRSFKQQKVLKPVWNNNQRVNHKNHSNAKRNHVPQAALTVNAARTINAVKKVNTAKPKVAVNVAKAKAKNNAVKGKKSNAVKASACWGNPQEHLQDKEVINSGCFRNMTGNMYFLTHYEEIDGGYVAFGGNPKGRKIIGKGGLTCLFAKATEDGSKLWHRRLGHLNFKTINKLVKRNLVRGTKDKTSGTFKSFITRVENLMNLRVKVIRCDNGTEFKNREMNQFCEVKSIMRQYSVARTPQQNKVAGRRNRTLIEAPRTMLADLKMPTTFWAKAVNTACYVQNRVLVTKPHNKTPYELFHGRIPFIRFLRPFRCHVTILNTIDHLAGSKNRPPMLNKENYVPWSSRLFRYDKSRPIGKLIYNFIINGPYVRRMILEPGDSNREVPVNETFHVQTDDELTEKELKQIEADDQAIQTILLSLSEDIYGAVDTLHQDQPSFNQNYMQQPMPNPEDITDPTTVMNMALALMAKAFKLNYSTPTNNNQRISSNPRNRQIAQPRMNMGQERQTQMVGGNANQNPNGNGNLVAARAEGNATGHNGNQIRCYNCIGEEARIQLQAEEFDLMATGDLDEIEEVNANCILMSNLQQASTSGTQTDKAPVYDLDGSAEVYNYEDCHDNEIFNMFTQKEQYTELLQPIPEPHQVPQNDNIVISEDFSVEQSGRTIEQHPANVEETHLNKQLSKEKSTVSFLPEEKKKLKSDFKIREDELLVKQIKLEKRINELDNILVKMVTSNSIPTPPETKVVKNDKVIALAMFRINPFKPYREEKHVPNKFRASVRTKPITVSQPPVITKKVVNSDSNGLSSTGVDNTKTSRPQPSSNTKNDRVPYVSKSSRSKNKGVEVEEHHRKLLLSWNKKHMSSECNKVKLATQNVKSKVVCAMCKQCLNSINHDVCLLNYVNGMNSHGKKQKANVLINEKQKKQQPKVKKTKKVGSIKRLASPKPSKPISFLRWSPTRKMFDLQGKIIVSIESESESNYSKGDNACSFNPLEPTIKRFPNFTFSLASNSNMFMVRRLGLFQAYDKKSKASHKFHLEVFGNCSLRK